jgi:uncharacterized protein (UPF0335 family)
MSTQVRSIFGRWQRLEADKKAIADDLKDLFAEAKGNGYEPKALRIAFRQKAKEEAGEADPDLDALVAVYLSALDEPAPRAHPAPVRTRGKPKPVVDEPFDPETGELEDRTAAAEETVSAVAPAAVATTASAEPAADKGSASIPEPQPQPEPPALRNAEVTPIRAVAPHLAVSPVTHVPAGEELPAYLRRAKQ